MIKTESLQKIFRTEDVEIWALNNVSLEIAEGEFVAVMVTHSQHDAEYVTRAVNLFDSQVVTSVLS